MTTAYFSLSLIFTVHQQTCRPLIFPWTTSREFVLTIKMPLTRQERKCCFLQWLYWTFKDQWHELWHQIQCSNNDNWKFSICLSWSFYNHHRPFLPLVSCRELKGAASGAYRLCTPSMCRSLGSIRSGTFVIHCTGNQISMVTNFGTKFSTARMTTECWYFLIFMIISPFLPIIFSTPLKDAASSAYRLCSFPTPYYPATCWIRFPGTLLVLTVQQSWH